MQADNSYEGDHRYDLPVCLLTEILLIVRKSLPMNDQLLHWTVS
jgi:hypothetical protein